MLFCRLANANEWFDEFERRGSRRLPIIEAFQVALRKTWNSGGQHQQRHKTAQAIHAISMFTLRFLFYKSTDDLE